MTREQMIERMKEIEARRDRLAMIDVWSAETRRIDTELFIEWRQLMMKIKEEEK